MKGANCDSGPNLHSWCVGLGLESTGDCTKRTYNLQAQIRKDWPRWTMFEKSRNIQRVIGRRWAKEGVEVYQDLSGEFGGAGGMVDSQPGIVAHDERIGCEGFGTIRTPF